MYSNAVSMVASFCLEAEGSLYTRSPNIRDCCFPRWPLWLWAPFISSEKMILLSDLAKIRGEATATPLAALPEGKDQHFVASFDKLTL